MARGFFAEIQHQAKIAARERARDERAAERAYKAAMRKAEQARKAAERAAAQLARATEAERKRLAKEAREAHIASMEADVERQNIELMELYDELDSLLAATLDIDDFVDLETLRAVAEHPPFDRKDLEEAIAPPLQVPNPPKPRFREPVPPKGLLSIFNKKKNAKASATAKTNFEKALSSWQAKVVHSDRKREDDAKKHAAAEASRLIELEKEQTRYAAECSNREDEVVERNMALDQLIANLGYGTADAVQEYISIVLSNSVYPSHFPVSHNFSFDSQSAELNLRVLIPGPNMVPTTKAFKYAKSADEITSSSASMKQCKDRYSGAVHQVAIRSLHEVFEADRRGLINTINLEVGTETIDPGTGLEIYLPFVATGAEREAFLKINLAAAVPASTLAHLGASVSKNPFGLVPADTKGVRRS